MTGILDRLSSSLADRYRVERELGAGGMATVYLAVDLKHGRRVALKVLHPELAAVLGAERFLTEIKTTAHLQHPNILQLFDSGAADGLLYYVMPFVDGETLRGRLTREKQLPLNDAIAIARGAAAALDYAHRHGVIHRDIKPENILLQDGQPLVADFGIALAVKAAGGVRLTQTGLSLGTPQYMSPEQATAERELDARSDVYALGAVTYEMLAGEPPFTGNTTQAIIAKLMTEEPRALSVLRRSVPQGVEAAVHRALEKLPADRFASAAEFGAALGDGKTTGYTSRTASRAGAPVARQRPRLLAFALVGVTAVLLGALAGRWFATRGAAVAGNAPPSRLAIVASEHRSFVSSGLARVLDISPDGQTVAYSASGAAFDYVILRRLDGETSTVPSSGGVRNLHISPDGRYLYSPRGSPHMQRITVSGGTWTQVPGVEATPYISWESDGTVWWSPDIYRGLHRVRPGSEKDEAPFGTGANGKTNGFTMQQVLPGDRTALVIDNSAANAGPAAIVDLGSGTSTPLFDFPVVEIRYTDGVLVYARPDNTLFGVAFDPAKGKVIGEPVPLADDVSLTGAGVAQFAVSQNGTVVYLPTFGRELTLIDRAGLARSITDAKLNYHSPRFSPDGKRIALDNVTAEGRDVWIFDREQNQLTRTTFDKDGHDPEWAADGKSIFYSSARSGTFGIYRIRTGIAGGTSDSLFANSSLAYTGIPLGDGKTLVTSGADVRGKSASDVVLVHPGQANALEPLFATPFNEGWAAPSPDGKWVAFTSDQTGRQEVYIHPLSVEGALTQVSLDGGSEPVWSRDGKELFYRRWSGARVELMSAAIQPGPEIMVTRRTTLFDASDYEPAQPHANYDVSPDGKSFVMLKRSPSSHIVIIQNVRELVRRSRVTAPR
jgi:eukaryotic-like serine/threonine-protein kinase